MDTRLSPQRATEIGHKMEAYERRHGSPFKTWHQQQRARRFVPRKKRDYSHIARQAEEEVARMCQVMGYQVNRTTSNAPWDYFVEGVKVEVKGATWRTQKRGGGRYEAAIRNHQADVVIFDCINGSHHLFVIPMSIIAPRKHISIWQYHVEESTGQWRDFLDAWHYLEEAVAANETPWQLPLF